MVKYIKVKGQGGVRKFPLDKEDVPLLLSLLQSGYPEAQGLLYQEDDIMMVVPSHGGEVGPPPEGWSDCVRSHDARNPTAR